MSDARQDLREKISAALVSANRDLVHFVHFLTAVVADAHPPLHSCRCGFAAEAPAQIDQHVTESRGARTDALRRLLRAHVASELEGDLDGGEQFKEVWGSCENDDERRAVRAELQAIIVDVIGGRSSPSA